MTSAPRPADFVGYAVEELRDYLEAAERRIEELRAAIATARAAQPSEDPDAESARRRVALAWMAAQREADTIRDQAEREERAIIDSARQLVGEAPATAAEQMSREGPAGDSPATDWRP